MRANRIMFLPIVIIVLLLIDWYFFQAVKIMTQSWSEVVRRNLNIAYWSFSIVLLLVFLVLVFFPNALPRTFRTGMTLLFFANYVGKILAIPLLLADDLIRGFKYIFQSFFPSTENIMTTATDAPTITRSEFLAKAAGVIAATPAVVMTFGILSGAHDYRVRKKIIALKNLPQSFDGLKIIQLSDIHSGSFFHKKSVQGGIDMVLAEKPDVIFFTGDLVNNTADEMRDYQDLFARLKAPLGVYSTLGNHDYGDYVQWSSETAKQKNLQDLMQTHKNMGWNLLMNEHKMLQQNNEKIAIIGVENWGGRGNFPKYGRLQEAYQNTDEAAVKLLLSHDPSHWDAQVRTMTPDIDITFSGHTHGMQFGIDSEVLKWSPVQYMYKQWAGLYQENHQYLYVNRGFGYIGFPGRVGILPEITVIELKRA
jgi:predicted MPP superfamily phosphohydrolase